MFSQLRFTVIGSIHYKVAEDINSCKIENILGSVRLTATK